MAVKKKKIKAKKTLKKKVIKAKKITKKKSAKKSFRKRAIKKPSARKKNDSILGVITHYFPKVRAAVIKLKSPLAVGDTVKIKGHTTDFTQRVDSIQIDHAAVTLAKKGDEVGVLVNSRVRGNDKIYKI